MSINWNNHPIIISITSGAAVLTLCIIIFSEVLSPLITSSMNNEIKSLNEEVETLKSKNISIAHELDFTKSNLTKAENELKIANESLFLAQEVNLFIPGNPYPTTLSLVKIGDPEDRISTVFGKNLEIKKGIYYVKSNHSIFNEITYFIDKKTIPPSVSHISFDMGLNHKKGNSFLQNKIEDNLGHPFICNEDFYSWRSPLGLTVYKSDDYSYLLMSDSQQPGYWPDKDGCN